MSTYEIVFWFLAAVAATAAILFVPLRNTIRLRREFLNWRWCEVCQAPCPDPMRTLYVAIEDETDDDEDPAAGPGGGVETPVVPEGPGTAAVGEER